MAYKTDFSNISLHDYKQRLKAQDMIPSWIPLLENIDDQFERLNKNGISNIEELREKIRTKKRLKDFNLDTSIDSDYLTLLARELNSRVSKPLKLSKFPNQDKSLIKKLEASNIKSTEQLYNAVYQSTSIKELSEKMSVPSTSLQELICLSELTRMRWVSHTFAYVLYKSGYNTVKAVSQTDVSTLYKEIKSTNVALQLYKGSIGERDIQRCIDDAKFMPFEIDFDFN